MVTQRRKLQRTAKDAVKAKEIDKEVNRKSNISSCISTSKSNKKKQQNNNSNSLSSSSSSLLLKKNISSSQNIDDDSSDKNSSNIVSLSNNETTLTPMKKQSISNTITSSSRRSRSRSRSTTPRKRNSLFEKSPIRSSPRQRTTTDFYLHHSTKSKILSFSETKEKLHNDNSNSSSTSNEKENKDITTEIITKTPQSTKHKEKTTPNQQWQCNLCTTFNDSNKRKCHVCLTARRNATINKENMIVKKRRTTRLGIEAKQEEESDSVIFFTPQEEMEEDSQEFTSTQLSPDLLLDTTTTSNGKKKFREEIVEKNTIRKRNIIKRSSQLESNTMQSQKSKDEDNLHLKSSSKSKLNHEDSESESSCIILEEKSPFIGKRQKIATVNKNTSMLQTTIKTREEETELSQLEESYTNPFTSTLPTTIKTRKEETEVSQLEESHTHPFTSILPTTIKTRKEETEVSQLEESYTNPFTMLPTATKTREEETEVSHLEESHTNPFILNTPSTVSTIPLPLLSHDGARKKNMGDKTTFASFTMQKDVVEQQEKDCAVSTSSTPLFSVSVPASNIINEKGVVQDKPTFASPTMQKDVAERQKQDYAVSTSSTPLSYVSVPKSNTTKKEKEVVQDKPTPRALNFTPSTSNEREIQNSHVIVKPTPQSAILPSSVQTKTDKSTCPSVQSTTSSLPTPTLTYQLTPLGSSSTTTPTYNNSKNNNFTQKQRQAKLIQDLTNLVSEYKKEEIETEQIHLQQLCQIQKRQIASLAMKFEEEKTKRIELEQCILSWWKEKNNECDKCHSSLPNWMKCIVDVVGAPEQNDVEEELSQEVEDNTNSQIRSIVASAAAQFRPTENIVDEKNKEEEQRNSTTLKGWNRNIKEGMVNFTDIPVTTNASTTITTSSSNTPTPKKKAIINPYAKKPKKCTSEKCNQQQSNVECEQQKQIINPYAKKQKQCTSEKCNQQQCNAECEQYKQQQQPYKYKQVVRNKDTRRGLPGHDCEHCRAFVNAVCQGGGIDRQSFLNNCSRHKCEFSPDATPDGYWELSFADSMRNRGA